jgi:S-adenosylmethionine synthetase
LALDISHRLLWVLSQIRKEGKVMTYLRPDAKSQVTIEYSDDNQAQRIHTIVISTQHDDFIKPVNKSESAKKAADKKMLEQIKQDVQTHVIPRVLKDLSAAVQQLFKTKYILHVNPTGVFVIGGPHGDSGLTGRKIIVDTYGGKGAHGGGAFSGKDPSKVDRSAAYATRHIAKNMVAAGICDEVLVQVAYAIGVAHPVSLHVNTYGTAKVALSDGAISKIINEVFDMTPYAIEKRFKLRTPIYSETAAYGHMGRESRVVTKTFKRMDNGTEKEKAIKVELFPWEKTDYVATLKKAFKLK